jgi:hypothetical protein
VFTVIDAKLCERAGGAGEEARLGLLFGFVLIGAFVAVNYATINPSEKLALELAVSELIEWAFVGVVVVVVYKPRGG